MKHVVNICISIGYLLTVCSSFADDVYVANFTTFEARQKTPEWCWAASAQMVLNSGGADITQETIVNAIKGQLVVQGASNLEIMRALNSCGFDMDGKLWKALAVSNHGAPIPAALVEQLLHNHPVIVSYSTGPMASHVVVIHEATYSPSLLGPAINSVTIFDPYTGQDFHVDGRSVLGETLDSWYVSVYKTRGEIARTMSDDTETKEIDCPKCNGTGTLNTRITCAGCRGTGTLICAQCMGTGFIHNYFGQTFICPGCGGTGKLRCLACDGTGSVSATKTCQRCHGTGKITVLSTASDDSP
jgi:hypothetical protein